jgi:hypothetical protein
MEDFGGGAGGFECAECRRVRVEAEVVAHPEHGDLELPAGWEFLPSGDAFVTKRVKAAGVYWIVWRPRGKNRPHRRKLGVFAPARAISQARSEAEETAERRAQQRTVNARYRDKVEDAYRSEFEAAVLTWLDFAAEHTDVAGEIAHAAADQAVVVGSGGVGRTRALALEERAALAARATIRHRFTDYDDRLSGLDSFDTEIDDVEYREIKRSAQDVVDEFLRTHRQQSAGA